MGWQDRDWAKWTDEERARFYGGGVRSSKSSSLPRTAVRLADNPRARGTLLLAVLVSGALSLAFGVLHVRLHILRTNHPATAASHVTGGPAPVLYGTRVRTQADGSQLTCTSMVTAANGGWSCIRAAIVMPGQRTALAAPLPRGRACAYANVDQVQGRWTCVRPKAANPS